MKTKEHKFESRLRSAGLKVTPTRLEILEILSRGCAPLTVEELHKQLKKSDCDVVTLYRALASFHKALLVRRCDLGDGPVRYEMHDHDGAHHHHVVCMECRKMESIDLCLVETFENALRKKGYSNVSHSLEFFGVCQKCGPKRKESRPTPRVARHAAND